MFNWIEENKGERPFHAGALAYIMGRDSNYGCHYGMRSTAASARQEFWAGWESAKRDCEESGTARFWGG